MAPNSPIHSLVSTSHPTTRLLEKVGINSSSRASQSTIWHHPQTHAICSSPFNTLHYNLDQGFKLCMDKGSTLYYTRTLHIGLRECS